MKQLMVLVLVCCLVPLVAVAQQPPNPPQRWDVPPPPLPPPPPAGSGKWWKNSSTVRALELTEGQVSQLEAVYLEHQKDLATLRSTLLQQESRLRALLEVDRLDEAALAAQRVQLSAARVELEKQNSEMTLAMRRLMTGDQWRRLEKIREASLPPPSPPIPPPPSPPPPPPPAPIRDAGADEKVYDMKTTPGLQNPVLVSQTQRRTLPRPGRPGWRDVVLVEAIIRKDGSVGDVKVLKGLGYGLDESAVRTVKTRWRFRPALLQGQPVNARISARDLLQAVLAKSRTDEEAKRKGARTQRSTLSNRRGRSASRSRILGRTERNLFASLRLSVLLFSIGYTVAHSPARCFCYCQRMTGAALPADFIRSGQPGRDLEL